MNKSIRIFSFLAIMLAFIGCDTSTDEVIVAKKELVVQYTFVKETTPGLVSFLNTSDGADTFMWKFGDNTSSTVKSPIKTYAKTGDYSVELTATNTKTGMSKTFTSTVSVFIFDGGLLKNGNFGSGVTAWNQGVDNPIGSVLLLTENGNTYYSINVTAVGNAFDVNLSQKGLNIVKDGKYRLTFDAWSNVNRTMLAGIGLSGAPWDNVTNAQELTPTKKSFSLDLTANFTGSNSRVIFDMGAAIGRVNIDNVTLTIVP